MHVQPVGWIGDIRIHFEEESCDIQIRALCITCISEFIHLLFFFLKFEQWFRYNKLSFIFICLYHSPPSISPLHLLSSFDFKVLNWRKLIIKGLINIAQHACYTAKNNGEYYSDSQHIFMQFWAPSTDEIAKYSKVNFLKDRIRQ